MCNPRTWLLTLALTPFTFSVVPSLRTLLWTGPSLARKGVRDSFPEELGEFIFSRF